MPKTEEEKSAAEVRCILRGWHTPARMDQSGHCTHCGKVLNYYDYGDYYTHLFACIDEKVAKRR